MLQVNCCFVIQSTILLFVMSRGVFCEKNGILDIHRRYDLGNSAETKMNGFEGEIRNSSMSSTSSFTKEKNGTALVEETANYMPGHSNRKLIEKQLKFGNIGGSELGHKKKKNQKQQQGLVQKILPLMIIPFMISTAIIPVMLFVIKLLFVKAALVAKIAVTLGIISFFRRKNKNGGVYNYNVWKMR